MLRHMLQAYGRLALGQMDDAIAGRAAREDQRQTDAPTPSSPISKRHRQLEAAPPTRSRGFGASWILRPWPDQRWTPRAEAQNAPRGDRSYGASPRPAA